MPNGWIGWVDMADNIQYTVGEVCPSTEYKDKH